MQFLKAVAILTILVIGLTTAPWSVNSGRRQVGVSASDESMGQPGNYGVGSAASWGERSPNTLEQLSESLVNTEQARNTSSGVRGNGRDRTGRNVAPVLSTNIPRVKTFGDGKNINGDKVRKFREEKKKEDKQTRKNHSGKRNRYGELPPAKVMTDGSSGQRTQFKDAVTVPKSGNLNLGAASSAENDNEAFTDIASGFGDDGQVGSTGSAEVAVDDTVHPLGAEFARIHEDVLNGIVPKDVTATFGHAHHDLGHAPHDTGHALWAMDEFHPHGMAGVNTHPLNIPHEQDLGMQLSHGGGLNHPFSSDIPHHMGGHLDTNDIVFDFGAFDFEGHNADSHSCYGQCMCHDLTVSCFWCNLTEVPAGINPATKTL